MAKVSRKDIALALDQEYTHDEWVSDWYQMDDEQDIVDDYYREVEPEDWFYDPFYDDVDYLDDFDPYPLEVEQYA